MNPEGHGGIVTFLFTDIEGSTRLWEQQPESMQTAVARHDALTRAAVAGHRGRVVKMTGDGVYAAFDDPLDAIIATLELQQALDDPQATAGVALRLRCGLHAGVVERRDDDFFGGAVNRAARIMGAAHGGQVLVSQAVAALVRDRLADGIALRDLGAVRLRDLANPEHVCQLLHPRLRQDFPALRSLEATPNNLPQQVTSFIGRERELARARELLGGTRLLTLLGVGGLGKTRLSLQLAADVLDDGIALTAQLVGQTLTVALPEGVRLCDVPASERRPEIEFQFSLQPVQVDALLRLLHAHGVVASRHGFGLRQKLEGLMTGLIDLTYRHGGKWYVLDYKSNRLPGYDDAGLQHAMAHSEYDLQALIYTLALHRWLRFRLGAGYDYARDFGGIRYLFCRGLDAGSAASPGIHAQRFPPELVHALDALFGHAEGVAA